MMATLSSGMPSICPCRSSTPTTWNGRPATSTLLPTAAATGSSGKSRSTTSVPSTTGVRASSTSPATRNRPACTPPPFAFRYSSLVPRMTTLSSSTLPRANLAPDAGPWAPPTRPACDSRWTARSSVDRDLLAVAVHPPGVVALDPRMAVHVERVGAQELDLLLEAPVEPLDDGHDGDHRGDADDDPQRGEEGAQARAHQRPEGDPEALEELRPGAAEALHAAAPGCGAGTGGARRASPPRRPGRRPPPCRRRAGWREGSGPPAAARG